MTDSDSPRRYISYSQYSMWKTCPLQYRLLYVDKVIPRRGSIHTVFGGAIHEAIQAWLDKHYNESTTLANVFDIDSHFKEALIKNFEKEIQRDDDGNIIAYPCDQTTLQEFYQDGQYILSYVRKHKSTIFPKDGYQLVGCEVELAIPLTDGLQFTGYIDIVLYHKPTKTYTIIDLKTSTKGWWDSDKRDPKKINQILLYKDFYSKQFDVSADQIEVKFLILKRKINVNTQWTPQRVTKFEPSCGKVSVKRAREDFQTFVESAYEPDGTPKLENLVATPSNSSCRFCPFNKDKSLCPNGLFNKDW